MPYNVDRVALLKNGSRIGSTYEEQNKHTICSIVLTGIKRTALQIRYWRRGYRGDKEHYMKIFISLEHNCKSQIQGEKRTSKSRNTSKPNQRPQGAKQLM